VSTRGDALFRRVSSSKSGVNAVDDPSGLDGDHDREQSNAMASERAAWRTTGMSHSIAAVVAATVAASAVLPLLVGLVTEAPLAPALLSAAGGGLVGLIGLGLIARRTRAATESLVGTMHRFGAGQASARAAVSGIRELDQIATGFNAMASKVSQATKQLAHQAYHDPLTGLPNRNYFMSRLRTAIPAASRDGTRVAVLCLDLDRFKVINDTLGHAVGDELLSVLSVRLASTVGAEHMVARLGGDEFTVLLENTGEGETIGLAGRIVEAMKQPFHVHGHELFVTVSVGVAMSPRGTLASSTDLLRQADIALYAAKSGGAARFELYQPANDSHSADTLQLETNLRRAVERGELLVHYQPEIDLARGELMGMEALVRWQHGHRGLISPAQFIPLAEETGEIVRIGRHVLTQACYDTSAMMRRYPGIPLQVGVNVSAKEFRQPDLVANVAETLERTGLPPAFLELEITESAVIDDLGPAIDTLKRLRALGVGLAIDDFGTGYSSLSYLHQMPLTTLKIDRSFVRDVGKQKTPSAVARAIVDVASALGMEVVAEGIETREQLDYLRSLKCDRGQGFLFSKPLPHADFLNLVEARSRKVAQQYGYREPLRLAS
jgi:diguanylate cyclase (GGDEF)-like protein